MDSRPASLGTNGDSSFTGNPEVDPTLGPGLRIAIRESDDPEPPPPLFAALGPMDLDDESLISKFAPVYLLFPEGSPGSAPPHPKGSRDYHPRSVEHFLDDARLHWRRRWAVILLLGYYVVFVLFYAIFVFAPAFLPEAADTSTSADQFWSLFEESPVAFYLIVLTVGVGVPAIGFWLVNAAGPKGSAKIRDELEARLVGGMDSRHLRLADGLPWLDVLNSDQPASLAAERAWTRYCDKIKKMADEVGSPKYPLTVYVNVVPSTFPARRAIQYWTFYYYNHWENVHPADWECVQVFLADGDAPIAAAYSNHLGCLWRPWTDIGKLHLQVKTEDGRTKDRKDTDHPLVYVARGSHAQYFEPKDIGYDPPFAFALPTFRLPWRARLTATRRSNIGKERDQVVQVSTVERDAVTDRYTMREMPSDLAIVDPYIPEQSWWMAWWWLRYLGKWADVFQTIHGPAAQGKKWAEPWEWVRADGQADADWVESFHRSVVAAKREGGRDRASIPP